MQVEKEISIMLHISSNKCDAFAGYKYESITALHSLPFVPPAHNVRQVKLMRSCLVKVRTGQSLANGPYRVLRDGRWK